MNKTDIRQCKVCGKQICYNGHTDNLCNKHKYQLKKYGKFLDSSSRTKFDKNEYVINENVVTMYLYDSRGIKNNEFIFDLEDLDKIVKYKWYAQIKDTGYITIYTKDKNGKKIRLARLIMELKDSHLVIDHINGNTLDNRKENLRICSQSENTKNKAKSKNDFIGIREKSLKTKGIKYTAEITFNYKNIWLGIYDNIASACYARYIAEEVLFKDFANDFQHNKKKNMFSNLTETEFQKIKSNVITTLKKKGICK